MQRAVGECWNGDNYRMRSCRSSVTGGDQLKNEGRPDMQHTLWRGIRNTQKILRLDNLKVKKCVGR